MCFVLFENNKLFHQALFWSLLHADFYFTNNNIADLPKNFIQVSPHIDTSNNLTKATFNLTTIIQISPDINYICIVKKIFSIAILICYCIASFGVSINYFYCCGKLKTISLVAATEQRNCNTKSDKGCCNKKTITVKLKIDQKESNQLAYNFGAPLSAPLPHLGDYIYGSLVPDLKINPPYKRPPPGSLPSRQILFSIFRI
jgi:hypothetical protein